MVGSCKIRVEAGGILSWARQIRQTNRPCARRPDARACARLRRADRPDARACAHPDPRPPSDSSRRRNSAPGADPGSEPGTEDGAGRVRDKAASW